MDDLPLAGLTPGDPRNRLSKPARVRLVRAHVECDRIRCEAQANVDARHLSDAKAKYVLNQADLKAARTVMKVVSAEYADAGLTLREFWAAMEDEIDSIANSFSLYDTQRRLLEVEFSVPPAQKAARPHPLPAASAPPKPETIGEQINRLREECHLTPEELAVKIGIDVKSVRRHLKDRSIPYERTLWAYETLFSKLLNRQIVITKMS